MVYASSVHNNLDSLWQKSDILSNSFPSSINIHYSVLSFPKLRTYVRFQHDTAPYPLPRLIS
jgi:hypothetical protein